MSEPRPRRADAERNRARIVKEASRIYRQEGPEASMDSIAVAAGVGNATLYRHFPTRDELRTSVLSARLEDVNAMLDTLERETDPWRALELYIRYLAASPDNTFVDVLVSPLRSDSTLSADRERVRSRVRGLIDSARAAGQVREHYTVDDMNVFLFAHTKASTAPQIDLAASNRLLDDYLAGIHSAQGP